MTRFIVGIKPQAKCLLLSMCVGPNVKAVHARQIQWSRWKILLTALCLCSSLCGMAYYMAVTKGSVSGRRLDSLLGSFIQPSLHHWAHDHVTRWPPKWQHWSPHSFSPAPTYWWSVTVPQGCCSSPFSRALKGLLCARSWAGDMVMNRRDLTFPSRGLPELDFRWWWWFSHTVMYDSCDPVDCSPPGSSVHGILQARILQWVAISFSRGEGPQDLVSRRLCNQPT